MTSFKTAALLGAATLAGLAAVPAPAQAQIPSATGVYTACVLLDKDNDESRHLRLIDPATENCRKNETKVTWNEKGQKGDQGIQGIQGLQGFQGIQGIKGDKGDQGPKGDTGAQGSVGATGAQGPKGDTGATGATGAQGAQGLTGPSGPTGPQGPKGEDGAGLVNGTIAGQLLEWSGNSWVATLPTSVTLTTSNMQPFLTVNYIIALQGIFPSRNGNEPFIAEIELFAGNFAPQGWATCDGQLMSISQNTALFSLIGTQYGGNGQTTFALPDLRGRVPIHMGQGPGLTPRTEGESGGSETVSINTHHH